MICLFWYSLYTIYIHLHVYIRVHITTYVVHVSMECDSNAWCLLASRWLRKKNHGKHAVAMLYTALTLLATLVTVQGTDHGVQRLYLDQGDATLGDSPQKHPTASVSDTSRCGHCGGVKEI